MSEYKKTALVLGAVDLSEVIWSRRLRQEGYWVRGVDLKQPEYCASHANEFVVGDLRDTKFVARCIRYAGETGNFYAQIVDKF